jgi:hypothetical protein
MPRTNKVTEKVFAEIAETPQKKAQYTTFLDIDRIMSLPEAPELMALKDEYSELTSDNRGTISTLAAMEEIIIQFRCKEVVESELRLSLSLNKTKTTTYIYARSLFYRRGNKINDIRVVVGTTEEYGDDIDSLIKDENFRQICYNKLWKAMDKEIEINKLNLKTLSKV